MVGTPQKCTWRKAHEVLSPSIAFLLAMPFTQTGIRVEETNMKTSGLLARFSAIQAKKNAIKNIAHIAMVGMILFSPTVLKCIAAGQTPTSSTLPRTPSPLPNEFTPTEVFRLDWGPGENQVGLLQVFGGNYGPQSFALDEAQNQIYILDSTNSRIMIFDLNGSLLSAVSISNTADDLALAPGGDMLVLYTASKRVVQYYPSGLQRSVYPLPDTESPIKGIQFSPEFGAVVETADQQSFVLTTEEAVPAKGTQLAEPATTKSVGLKRGGSSFYLERTTSGEGTLRILDPFGSTQRALHIKSKEQRIVTLTLIGIDHDGNTYLTVEESGESAPVMRYIREFDSQGTLLAEALIPYSAYVFTSRDLRVTGDGRVYQLLPLKGAVEMEDRCAKRRSGARICKPTLFKFNSTSRRIHPGRYVRIDNNRNAALNESISAISASSRYFVE
jgi:hypothetical protein